MSPLQTCSMVLLSEPLAFCRTSSFRNASSLSQRRILGLLWMTPLSLWTAPVVAEVLEWREHLYVAGWAGSLSGELFSTILGQPRARVPCPQRSVCFTHSETSSLISGEASFSRLPRKYPRALSIQERIRMAFGEFHHIDESNEVGQEWGYVTQGYI